MPFDFALSLTFGLFSPWERHSHWVHLSNIRHTSAQLTRAALALLLSLIMTHASDSFTLHASLRFSLYSPGSFLHCVCVCMVSYVQLFATPWTAVHQAPLCMEFSREKYWSGLPLPAPGDLPNPGIEAMSPALAGGFFTTEPPGKSFYIGFNKHLQCMCLSPPECCPQSQDPVINTVWPARCLLHNILSIKISYANHFHIPS